MEKDMRYGNNFLFISSFRCSFLSATLLQAKTSTKNPSPILNMSERGLRHPIESPGRIRTSVHPSSSNTSCRSLYWLSPSPLLPDWATRFLRPCMQGARRLCPAPKRPRALGAIHRSACVVCSTPPSGDSVQSRPSPVSPSGALTPSSPGVSAWPRPPRPAGWPCPCRRPSAGSGGSSPSP